MIFIDKRQAQVDFPLNGRRSMASVKNVVIDICGEKQFVCWKSHSDRYIPWGFPIEQKKKHLACGAFVSFKIFHIYLLSLTRFSSDSSNYVYK